jgi:hypothetical protein
VEANLPLRAPETAQQNDVATQHEKQMTVSKLANNIHAQPESLTDR